VNGGGGILQCRETKPLSFFGGLIVNSTLNSNTQTDIHSAIWTVAGGYNLVQGRKVSLGLIAGAR